MRNARTRKANEVVLSEISNFMTTDWSDQWLIEEVVLVPVVGDDCSEIVIRPNKHVSDLTGFELALDDYPQYKIVSVTAS